MIPNHVSNHSKPFKSVRIFTAVEAVLRHVRVIGLAARVLVLLPVLVEVLLQALVVVVVRLRLHDPVPEIQCGQCPDHPGSALRSWCGRRGAGRQVGVFNV